MFSNDSKQLRGFFYFIISIFASCIFIYLSLRYFHVLTNSLLKLLNLILPFFIGLIFAMILNLPLCFFEKIFNKKNNDNTFSPFRRTFCIILSFLCIGGILFLSLFLIVPKLIDAVITVADLFKIDWNVFIQNSESFFTVFEKDYTTQATQILRSSFSLIFDIFIGIIFSFYILAKKEHLKTQVHILFEIWLPPKWNSLIFHIARVFSDSFKNFIIGQMIEAFILGFLCTVGMLLLQLPSAPTIGILVGVTALLPYIGAYLGAFIGCVLILTVSQFQAVIFLIYLIILQQIEGNVIYPKVMGKKIQLPSIWVLFALTVGGRIAGFGGMFLGIPTFAALYRLLKELTIFKQKKNLRSQ